MPRNEKEKMRGRKRLNFLILLFDAALIGYLLFVLIKAIAS